MASPHCSPPCGCSRERCSDSCRWRLASHLSFQLRSPVRAFARAWRTGPGGAWSWSLDRDDGTTADLSTGIERRTGCCGFGRGGEEPSPFSGDHRTRQPLVAGIRLGRLARFVALRICDRRWRKSLALIGKAGASDRDDFGVPVGTRWTHPLSASEGSAPDGVGRNSVGGDTLFRDSVGGERVRHATCRFSSGPFATNQI